MMKASYHSISHYSSILILASLCLQPLQAEAVAAAQYDEQTLYECIYYGNEPNKEEAALRLLKAGADPHQTQRDQTAPHGSLLSPSSSTNHRFGSSSIYTSGAAKKCTAPK